MCHLCWGEDRDELYDDGVDDYERDYDHWQFRQPYTIDRKNARMGKSPILVVSSKSITKPDSAYAQDSRPWKQAVVPKFEDNKNYLPEARRGSLKMPSAGEQLSMLASVDRKVSAKSTPLAESSTWSLWAWLTSMTGSYSHSKSDARHIQYHAPWSGLPATSLPRTRLHYPGL